MLFSHPIIRWLLSLRDNMIWKILGLIWYGLLGRRRHPSRAADIDALGRRWFARSCIFGFVAARDTLSSKTIRDLSPDTSIDAQGWFRQGETKPSSWSPMQEATLAPNVASLAPFCSSMELGMVKRLLEQSKGRSSFSMNYFGQLSQQVIK